MFLAVLLMMLRQARFHLIPKLLLAKGLRQVLEGLYIVLISMDRILSYRDIKRADEFIKMHLRVSL